MNTKKFKSVAVAIETYKLLKKLAALDDRSAGMQITYLVKQESKRRKLAAWPSCQSLHRIVSLNPIGSMKRKSVVSVVKSTWKIICCVHKKVKICIFGTVLDVTIFYQNHRHSVLMWDDIGGCIHFSILFAVSNLYAWLHKKWLWWFQWRVLHLVIW